MAEEKKSRAKSVMSSSKPKKAKTKKSAKKTHKPVHKLHIRHAANGGYISESEFPPQAEGAQPTPNEEHALPDMAALQQHVSDHMQQPQQEEQPQPQAGSAGM